MTINTSTIIGTVIFLIIIWIISWIISSHRFKTLIFAGLYLAAISPGLADLLAGFAFEKLVMVWFDSVLIYILFSIYLCALIVMLIFEKGWLQRKWKWSANPFRAKGSPPEETISLVKNTVERDLKTSLKGAVEAGGIEEIKKRDEHLMRKQGISPTRILEAHDKCLAEAEKSNDKIKTYVGCRVREET